MKKNNTNYYALSARICISLVLMLLAACSTAPRYNGGYPAGPDGVPIGNVDVSKIPNAMPKVEPLSKYGNPRSYVIDKYRYYVLASAKGYDKVGYASWYGSKFQRHLTSTREVYNPFSMTAASTILPLPTYVRVTNLSNNRSVIVKVNDRGPFKSNRIIDLSYAAAIKLGYENKGTALVRVTAIDPTRWQPENGRAQATYYAQNKSVVKTAPLTQVAANTADNNAAKTPIYLQVGAYANKQTANNLATKLAELTHKQVDIKPTYSNNILVYRIHVGPILGNQEYKKIRRELASYGFQTPMITAG